MVFVCTSCDSVDKYNPDDEDDDDDGDEVYICRNYRCIYQSFICGKQIFGSAGFVTILFTVFTIQRSLFFPGRLLIKSIE